MHRHRHRAFYLPPLCAEAVRQRGHRSAIVFYIIYSTVFLIVECSKCHCQKVYAANSEFEYFVVDIAYVIEHRD